MGAVLKHLVRFSGVTVEVLPHHVWTWTTVCKKDSLTTLYFSIRLVQSYLTNSILCDLFESYSHGDFLESYSRKHTMVRLIARVSYDQLLLLPLSQRAHDVRMTSYQRRCDVMTSHRRQSDVTLTSCACLVVTVWLSEHAQRAHDVIITSYQRRCDVMTSHRRRSDVIVTSYAYWVYKSEPSTYYM